MKRIRGRFHVAPATASKAFQLLQKNGHVYRSGKYFHAGDRAKARRISVGKDIRAIGLEGSSDFRHLNPTYLDIREDHVGYLMAHALIGDIAVEKGARGYLRVNAEIVERLTS